MHQTSLKHPWKVKLFVAQLSLTLCDPTDYSPRGSFVRGIIQARILEWVAIPFSRESSQPRDKTQVSRIAGGFFTSWATREAQNCSSGLCGFFTSLFHPISAAVLMLVRSLSLPSLITKSSSSCLTNHSIYTFWAWLVQDPYDFY